MHRWGVTLRGRHDPDQRLSCRSGRCDLSDRAVAMCQGAWRSARQWFDLDPNTPSRSRSKGSPRQVDQRSKKRPIGRPISNVSAIASPGAAAYTADRQTVAAHREGSRHAEEVGRARHEERPSRSAPHRLVLSRTRAELPLLPGVVRWRASRSRPAIGSLPGEQRFSRLNWPGRRPDETPPDAPRAKGRGAIPRNDRIDHALLS